MGKKKEGGEKREQKHSPATVYVSNLPYSFTNDNLQETFSDVGPIRRCFLVKPKGSKEHLGFGYVQFATIDDATRSIELKNVSDVGGRKIGVKFAMQRASLEQRRLKGSGVAAVESDAKTKIEKEDSAPPEVENTQVAASEHKEQPADSEQKKPAKISKQKEQPADSEQKKPAKISKQKEQPADSEQKKPAKISEQKEQPADSEQKKSAKTSKQKEQQPADSEQKKSAKASKQKKQSADSEQKKPATTSNQKEVATISEQKEVGAASEQKEQALTSKQKGKSPRQEKSTVSKSVPDGGETTDKQRVAKTVVFGGLLNSEMAEDVHSQARECGTVTSLIYPLPAQELQHHGLAQDGCRLAASSVVFTSVKSARACVSKLHQKTIKGGVVWARQLGGEGAKAQKWKLIIRNLPFTVKSTEIKDTFSSAGFVWDVYIPQNPNGSSRGFAFVKFTCKQDAENAILTFNGKRFWKRLIAVDWTIPKDKYASGLQSAANLENELKESDTENDDSTASEDDDVETSEKSQESQGTDVEDESSSSEDEAVPEEVDFDFSEEVDVSRKVLNNLLSSNSKEAPASVNGNSTSVTTIKTNEPSKIPQKSVDTSTADKPQITKPEIAKPVEGEDALQRTIFIGNLSFDSDRQEVMQRFSSFGEVETCHIVLHPITRKPKGTAFLKFKTVEAVDAAFSAAHAGPGLGIFIKGRELQVLKAVDKNTAEVKKEEKTKKENHDHRNLYLAKEGVILEGTPAAEGVSADDLSKRQMLERSKAVKLRSPNFHVSRTRLIIYNLPKSMKEKQLKSLCIKAVISRATKQKPTIQQIKILSDSKQGQTVSRNHSRGVAFVEFKEHEHALVALRVLNNNPETFGPEHRPIVEFALDNALKLKQRNDKLLYQQQNPYPNAQQSDGPRPDRERQNKPLRKHDSRGDDNDKNNIINTKTKDRLENNAPEAPLSVSKEVRFPKRPRENKFPPKEESVKENISVTGTNKRKFSDRPEPENKKRPKRNKDPLGRDTVDKLDMLIEQYRSKFSRPSNGDKSGSEKQGSRQLGRWFQS